MKKILLFAILPVLTPATQYFSFIELKYYTLPHSDNINQDVYHEEACIAGVIMRELANSGLCRIKRMELIKKYLIEKNTPESLRLWSDIEELLR